MQVMNRSLREARDRELDEAILRNQRPQRRGFSGLAVALVLLVGIFVGVRGLDLFGLPSLHNPFSSKTVDTSAPPLLKSLSDLSRYDAASGDFQEIVDIEHDVDHVPAALAGRRTLFQATGTVDAYVDFTSIGEGAIVTSADGKSVTVTVPKATLGSPNIDPTKSKVISRQTGLLDRVSGAFSSGSSTTDQELYVAAQKKIAASAASGGLQARAEDNTRTMLTKMLGSLGYTDVTVNFVADTRP